MLKNVLSLLLSKFYSKKENEAVGHQAMPSGNKIDIAAHPAEIEVWTNFATYTTPTDGYVSIRAESYKSTAAIQISTGSEDKMPSIFTAANNAGEWLQTVIPVSKGVSVRLQGGGIKNVVSYFSKTIGGGYQVLKKFILQGGGLCLNSLSSSLRRSSCRVRRNGSEVKGFSQAQIKVQPSLLTPVKHNFTRLHATVGLRLGETKHRLMLGLRDCWGPYALIRKDSLKSILQFVRGTLLAFTVKQQILNRLRQDSFPAKGQRNTPLVGGASC